MNRFRTLGRSVSYVVYNNVSTIKIMSRWTGKIISINNKWRFGV